MRRLFVLVFFILFSSTVFGQTFTWETATGTGTDPGATVSETVGGVTVTVSVNAAPSGGRYIQLINGGGYAGSSGNLAMASVTNIQSVKFTFSQAVNINSIYAVEASGDNGGTWTYTPTGGSNSTVIDNISAGTGHAVNLNWTGVTSFTVSKPTEYGGGGLAFDNMILRKRWQVRSADHRASPLRNQQD